MPMNLVHRRLCSSAKWADSVQQSLLPWALADVDLSGDVLEIGPGFGATTRVLAQQLDHLTALEIDEASAMKLAGQFDKSVRIVHGDGTAMPFDDSSYDAIVCFTMLHHVPSPQLQDKVFFEVARGRRFRGQRLAHVAAHAAHPRRRHAHPARPGRVAGAARAGGLA
jgi:SAM-dependent methyltransferase